MAKQTSSKTNPSKNANWSVFSTPSSMRTYAKKMIARWNKRFTDNEYEMPKHFSKNFDVEFSFAPGDDSHLKDTRSLGDNVYTVCIIKAINSKKLPAGSTLKRTVWYGVSKKNPMDQDRPEVGRKLAFNKAFRQMLEDCMYWTYIDPREQAEKEADQKKLATVRVLNDFGTSYQG